jgi:hypothetical protein
LPLKLLAEESSLLKSVKKVTYVKIFRFKIFSSCQEIYDTDDDNVLIRDIRQEG